VKIRYIAPKTKDGKIQQCPVVCKNRDVLIGHINCLNSIMNGLIQCNRLDDEIAFAMDLGLDSTRFNNWIDDGVDCSNMSPEEIHEILNSRVDSLLNRNSNHPENNRTNLNPGFFSVDCTGCGNFVRWNNAKEIPYEDYKCDLCDRVLIHYIHLDDEDIIFDDGDANEQN